MILDESDYHLIINALEEYSKKFEKGSMSLHDLQHLIENYEKKLKGAEREMKQPNDQCPYCDEFSGDCNNPEYAHMTKRCTKECEWFVNWLKEGE